MPLILHEPLSPAGELGLWQIEEPEPWFLEKLVLNPAEAEQLARIKGHRRLEWLAARQLVHEMSGREVRGAFTKDENGKPHLEGSAWHISISHSHGLAAAIAAPVPVGVDIQILVERIERIARKFMRPEEMASLIPDSRLAHLHVYWGAKEALFKAYGRKKLDFCRHLHVNPFPFDLPTGKASACIKKNDCHGAFQVWYRMLGGYMLVYVMERTD